MAKNKIKWQVEQAPTGLYRSFHRRGWPSGRTSCNMFLMIGCADEYIPARVKTGEHSELHLSFRDHASQEHGVRRFAKRFKTLTEVKEFAANIDFEVVRAANANKDNSK